MVLSTVFTRNARILLGAVALSAAAWGQPSAARSREVVIGYQDMVLPWRYAQETKAVEERTGY